MHTIEFLGVLQRCLASTGVLVTYIRTIKDMQNGAKTQVIIVGGASEVKTVPGHDGIAVGINH